MNIAEQKDILTPSDQQDDISPLEIENGEKTDNNIQEIEYNAQNYIKEIPVTDISEMMRPDLLISLETLSKLKDEIQEKRIATSEKRDFIKEKIEHLKISGKVNIDEEEFVRSDVSVQEFVQLLDKMIKEIENDISFYSALLSAQKPSHVSAFKHEPDDFESFLKNRIALMKKYSKNAKRDLAISFSRYILGFDAQIRQITLVERALRYMQDNQSPGSQE